MATQGRASLESPQADLRSPWTTASAAGFLVVLTFFDGVIYLAGYLFHFGLAVTAVRLDFGGVLVFGTGPTLIWAVPTLIGSLLAPHFKTHRIGFAIVCAILIVFDFLFFLVFPYRAGVATIVMAVAIATVGLVALVAPALELRPHALQMSWWQGPAGRALVAVLLASGISLIKGEVDAARIAAYSAPYGTGLYVDRLVTTTQLPGIVETSRGESTWEYDRVIVIIRDDTLSFISFAAYPRETVAVPNAQIAAMLGPSR